MKVENYLSISQVALRINVNVMSIKRWYLWYENNEFEKPADLKLPKYYHKDRRKTKYFKESDIPQLEKFRDLIKTTHRGAMRDFNAVYCWGNHGKKVLGDNYRDVRRKVRNV